jgi:hypothetical protein
VAALRYLEPVVFGEIGELAVAPGLFEGFLGFLIVDVGNALKKQHRKDVRLEICGVHRPAKDIGRLPEMVRKYRKFQNGS